MTGSKSFLKSTMLTKRKGHKPINSIRDYQQYRMYAIKNGTNEKKELVFGDVSWRDNIESLGLELSFSLPRNVDDIHMVRHDVVNVGDGIILKNLNEVIFEGMVESIGLERTSKNIICYDYAYLLSKTAILKQFNNIKGHTAIQSICSERGIPIGNIAPMSVSITEIYNNQSISDIFKDIIEKEKEITNKNIIMEMRNSKLFIEDMNMNVLTPSYKPAANLSAFNPADVPGTITKNATLDNMKNHVQVVYQETEGDVTTVRTVATAVNQNSINKYGRRTHIESVSEDEVKNAQTIANNKLRELQGMEINVTVEMLGDDRIRSGRVITMENDAYNLMGKYKVINCEQTYSNRTRKMVLDLEGV